MINIFDVIRNLVKDVSTYPLELTTDILLESRVWVDNGSKTFIMSSDLVDALKSTTIPTIKPSQLHYPFESFALYSENGFFEMSGDLNVKALIVNTDKAMANLIKLFDANNNEEFGSILVLLLFEIMDGSGSYGVSLLKHRCDKILTPVDLVDPELLDAELKDSGRMDSVDQQRALNILVNSILYINDPTRIREETEERKIIRPLFKKDMNRPKEYIYLTVPKNFVKTDYASNLRGKISKHFLVRGHWRNQKIGSGRQETKLIWIYPFWKGPLEGEFSSKAYKVS